MTTAAHVLGSASCYELCFVCTEVGFDLHIDRTHAAYLKGTGLCGGRPCLALHGWNVILQWNCCDAIRVP